MKILKNQQGIALITAVMFTLICLIIIMMMMYYVLSGTKMSAPRNATAMHWKLPMVEPSW